ncbi:hypothetical protein RhiJN_06950 [Ceratobasidium sp. AG-Ba]|nr:hypothetical protein RhiJN_06950 [Ceratobasidium sp. AG-Ba]
MPSNDSKSSNLSSIPENPNSNSEPDSRSSSGSGSDEDSGEDSDSDKDEVSDDNPAEQEDIDELVDDSSERAVNVSNQGDQVGYNTQIRKDIGMSDEDDTEPPVRKLAVKSARRRVMPSDDEDEDEGVGGGDKMEESGIEVGTTVVQGCVEPSEPGGLLVGAGTPDKAKTPPDAPESMERGAERLSSLSSEPALDPDNSARNSQAAADESGSAADGSRMNAVLDKLKERTATTRKQAAEQKMAENVQEELKGVEADAAAGAAKSSKAEKASKTKAAAKKGKKSKR